MVDENDVPTEILDMAKEEKKPSERTLASIGKALEGKKNEAVNYRAASGIEETWLLCEEAYAGIDNANRHEYNQSRWVKPTTMNAPITSGDTLANQADKKSTAFIRLTAKYVDAGAAKVGEILLPMDDKAFSFSPTPLPELIKGKEDTSQVQDQGIPLTRPARPEDMAQQGMTPPLGAPQAPPSAPPASPEGGSPPPQPGQPGAEQRVPLTVKDLAEEEMERAKKAAKKAETRIYDWMVECQHHREMRKVIFDAARIGVGIVKGPFPSSRRHMVMRKDKETGERALEIHEKIVPIDEWVDPWNIFPDPSCGENIGDGDYIFERKYFSEKQLRKLKGLPGYLDDQIDEAIEIGPTTIKKTGRNPNEPENRNPFEVWFYHGTMKREDFEVVNSKAAKGISKKQVYVIVTMVNDIVIRGSINPLDSGDLPYHSVPWLRRPAFWAGVGASEQLLVPQRMINAATRSMLNNAGVSSGPQVVINKEGIKPANGDWTITPNKIWYSSKDSNMDDIRKTFYSIDIGNVGAPLMEIINYALRMAEETTNIPLITQGLSGKTTPDTLGAAQLQDNNANQLLRRIGYGFDDAITEPLVKMYYEYLLLDPEVPDEEKGDVTINAHGSIAMVERSIQDQTIAQMTPLAENPMFGVNPKKWFKTLAMSKHLDPALFTYTEEEQAKMDQTPPPEAPAIAVAKIKAQVAATQLQADMQRAKEEDALARELAQLDAQATSEIEKLRNSTQQLKVKMDTDRDTTYVNAETQRTQGEFTAAMEQLRLKKELAQLEYATKHQLSLDQVKAKLADTSMKLQAQRELAAMDTKLQVHTHNTPSADALMKPPVQRPGKAGQGKAFTQGS